MFFAFFDLVVRMYEAGQMTNDQKTQSKMQFTTIAAVGDVSDISSFDANLVWIWWQDEGKVRGHIGSGHKM